MIGHQFILSKFGKEYIPTVAWHLDQFGHSQANFKLLSSMGYDALFFSRIDTTEKEYRK